MIELSYANVAGIVVIALLIGGTLAHYGGQLLEWSDARRARREQSITGQPEMWRESAAGRVEVLFDDEPEWMDAEDPRAVEKFSRAPASWRTRWTREGVQW